MDALRDGFDRSSVETIERRVAIGPVNVRIRFAGPALVDAVMPAFGRLPRGDEGDPEVTVTICDSASLGIPPPDPPWPEERTRDVGELRFIGERLRALCDPESDATTVVDVRSGQAFFHVPEPSGFSWWRRAAPLRAALHWLLMAPDRRMVHAGAVSGERGCALIVGKSGSGKSTLAIGCLQSGLGFLGDDHVLVTTDGAPAAHRVYATAKLDASSVARLPGIERDVVDPGSSSADEAVVSLSPRWAGSLPLRAPLRAVVIPRLLPNTATSIREVSAGTGLLALAPSTMFQLPGQEQETLAIAAEVVRNAPCFRLDVGGAPAEAAAAVAGVLDERA